LSLRVTALLFPAKKALPPRVASPETDNPIEKALRRLKNRPSSIFSSRNFVPKLFFTCFWPTPGGFLQKSLSTNQQISRQSGIISRKLHVKESGSENHCHFPM
jgi:hypothetical protein